MGISDESGHFRIVSPRPGTYRLRGDLIGYRPSESGDLFLTAGDTLTVELRLSARALLLEPLTVTASARLWWNRADLRPMKDFFDRWGQFAKPGFGHFMTRDSIAQYEGWTLNTGHMLLLNAMSVRSVTPSGRSFSEAAACRVYYLNGIRFPGAPKLWPEDLEGVEIYLSPNIPANFNEGGFPCGVIVYWTRLSPDPTPARRTVWTVMGALAVGIAAVVPPAATQSPPPVATPKSPT